MKRKRGVTKYVLLGSIMLMVALIMTYNLSQKEEYMSDDPLFGSFIIDNKDHSETINPADFLVSIDVTVSNEVLESYAREKHVDISNGCWVYSFEEKTIFKAEKDGDRLRIYDNGKVIGTIKYSCDKILGFSYNQTYEMNWRGEKFELRKELQGFIFP